MLTREEADIVVKEAIAQGWAEEANSEEYEFGAGSIDVHDWDEINRARRECGNEPFPNATGCTVELLFPGMYSGETYVITSTEDWRVLKAKVDELKEIIKQSVERGWQSASLRPKKAGKLGMYVEIVPRGGSRAYPVRVGGMRTWRKLCREYDNMINIEEHKELQP